MESDQIGNDNAAVKNIANFIVSVSKQVPKIVLQNISVIVPHLDGESYLMRNSVVQSIGHIIHNLLSDKKKEKVKKKKKTKKIKNVENEEEEEEEDAQNEEEEDEDGEDESLNSISSTRDSLLDILEERFRDVNAFTRSKTIKTWDFLCQNKLVPLNRFLTIIELNIGR